jgi:hypothetical protein
VLGVERHGEDVPGVEGQVVGGGDVERGYLVLLGRWFPSAPQVFTQAIRSSWWTDWQSPIALAR